MPWVLVMVTNVCVCFQKEKQALFFDQSIGRHEFVQGCFTWSLSVGGQRSPHGWGGAARGCRPQCPAQHLCTRPSSAILNCSEVRSASAHSPTTEVSTQPFHTRDSGLKGQVWGLCKRHPVSKWNSTQLQIPSARLGSLAPAATWLSSSSYKVDWPLLRGQGPAGGAPEAGLWGLPAPPGRGWRSRESSEKSATSAATRTIRWPGEEMEEEHVRQREFGMPNRRLERAWHAGGTERTQHYSEWQAPCHPLERSKLVFYCTSASYLLPWHEIQLPDDPPGTQCLQV